MPDTNTSRRQPVPVARLFQLLLRIAALNRVLVAKLERLGRRRSREDDAIARVAFELDQMNAQVKSALALDPLLASALGGQLRPRSTPRRNASSGRVSAEEQRREGRRVLLSFTGVKEVVERTAPDRRAVFFCVDGATVRLAPRPALLLRVLLQDSGQSEDNFVGWKSAAVIEEMAGKRLGPVTAHRVDMWVSRIRDALEAAGLPGELVQTNARLGKRFALRRANGL